MKAPDEPPTSIEPNPELCSILIELSKVADPITSIPDAFVWNFFTLS